MNQIGPYQIIGELGQGGMAMVYRALQPSVNRIVALKVLPSYLEDDAVAVKRFCQEAETAANLNHNNIVRVWDASVHQPPYYIAMEFLDGGTLADRLRNGSIPVEEALTIATQICGALDHAHKKHIIHRDIKPENVLFDRANRPVLADFGIARATQRTRLTLSGTKFGTPDYMSPEQAKGLRVDTRSDLYGVAALVYEMLVGRPPFLNEDPFVTMRQIIQDSSPPPRRFNPALPPSLDTLFARAFAKDPNQRFQNGAEFSQALADAFRQAAVEQQAVRRPKRKVESPFRPKPSPVPKPPTAPPVRGIRSRGFLDERQRRILLVALLLLVVGAIIGISVIYLPRERGGVGGNNFVPSVANKSYEEARKLIASYLKLGADEIVRGEDEYSSTVPLGRVIRSEPPAGQALQKGGKVVLVVSLGPRDIEVSSALNREVPPLTGLTLPEAKNVLITNGLQIGKITPAGGNGKVKYSDPDAGSKVATGTTIRLFLAEDTAVTEPVPVTKHKIIYGETEYLHRSRKIILKETSDRSLDGKEISGKQGHDGWITKAFLVTMKDGVEIGRSRQKGKDRIKLPTDDTIIRYTYKPPQNNLINVPNVRMKRKGEARRLLAGLGFKTYLKEQYSDSYEEGEVMQYSPGSARRGATIKLIVSKGKYPAGPREVPPAPAETNPEGGRNEHNFHKGPT